MGNDKSLNDGSSGDNAIELTKSATNYSRWMTDSFDFIKDRNVSQIVWPGSHNAGADKGAIDFIGEPWTACQDGRFIEQLRAGARFLDLRMVDNSYRKVTGNHSPTYKFVEVFEFQHGTFGNRRLEHLISDVKSFAEANPREFIMLHFKSYDTSRTTYAFNSLERFFKHLEPIKSRLLPISATRKTLGEIVATHPNSNVILSFEHGSVPGWPAPLPPPKPGMPPNPPDPSLLWSDIPQRWASADTTEKGVEALMRDTMQSPPTNYLWALSATVWDKGVVHLMRNSPIRTIPFADGGRKLNILMADFIEREDTQVSVVDKCIELNLQIAQDKTPPTDPTNLLVRQVRLTDEGAKDEYYQNTTLFSWEASTDAIGVRFYQMFQNGQHIFTAGGDSYLVKDMNKLNSNFAVRAVDIPGNVSGFSNEVKLIQDTLPPTMPSDLRFLKYGFPDVQVSWTAASDGNGSGVAGYEVRSNEVYKGYTVNTLFTLHGVSPTETLLIEVRAKDRNGNYSEWAAITRSALPELKDPRINYIPLDWDPNLFRATINWNPILMPYLVDMPLELKFTSNDVSLPLVSYKYDTPPVFTDYLKKDETFEVKASLVLVDTSEISTPVTVVLDGDVTLPEPAKNFRVTSHSSTEMVVSWDKSTSTDVVNYAVSANGLPPFLAPATASSYTLPMMSLAEYLLEVWSINRNGNTSIVESIKWISKPPEKPNAPKNLGIGNVGSYSAQFSWISENDQPVSFIYWLTGQAELSENYGDTVGLTMK